MATIATSRVALDVETLFDDVGPAYEPAFRSDIQDRSVAWVLDKLKDQTPAKTLDIGSGTGKPVCSSLADAGHDVLGIDISSVMIEHARKAVPNAKFEKASLLTYRAEKASFDAVTVYFSMIADISQDEIRAMFGKIYEWLRPDGVFVFATVALDNDKIEANWLGRPITGSSLSADEAIDSIRRVGFEIVHTEQETFVPKAVEVGLCEDGQVWPEPWVFVYATKSKSS